MGNETDEWGVEGVDKAEAVPYSSDGCHHQKDDRGSYCVYKSHKVVNGAFSAYAVNAVFSFLAINALLSFVGINCLFCIFSMVSDIKHHANASDQPWFTSQMCYSIQRIGRIQPFPF